MKNDQTISKKIWQLFCSVKFTVYLLVFLAATSVIGTIILQNGTEQDYVRLYGEGFYNLIKMISVLGD